ncbi:MAG: hypothetical protein IVW57_03475 [Ktedonobacterales bacterium]|nr:hypothetical protein [Ktedonobacterales bacterium]
MKRWQIYAAAGAAGLLLVAIGCLIWFSIEGWWPIVVDVVLSFTALASMVMLLALILAVFFFIRTLRELKAELTPVLESLKATSSAVQATATTATNFGVKPAIRTASFVIGATEVASLVLGRGHARKRSEKRQRRRQEIEHELAAKGDLNGAR